MEDRLDPHPGSTVRRPSSLGADPPWSRIQGVTESLLSLGGPRLTSHPGARQEVLLSGGQIHLGLIQEHGR